MTETIVAEQSADPDVDTLAQHVYGDPDTADQFARMGPGSPYGERELVLSSGLGSS